MSPTTKSPEPSTEDRELGESHDRWVQARDEASRLAKKYLAVGSGYGDPQAQEGDRHRLDTARYEEQQRYREYQDILSRAERSSSREEDGVPMSSIDVFISHSSGDVGLAKLIVKLLREALNLNAEAIRCSSLDGYRLPAGADSADQLRDEVIGSKTLIGLLSKTSLESLFVLFELGARWGTKKHLVPLMGPGISGADLRAPLGSLNALKCEEAGQMHQLVTDLAEILGVEPSKPAVYQHVIDDLVAATKAASAALAEGATTGK